MRPLLVVCGSDDGDTQLSAYALQTAEAVGRLIAQMGAGLVCGGRGGVMRAACKGAKDVGGLTIGILPENKEEANEYVEIALPTGLGKRRNFLVVSAGEAVIAIGGRCGTLSEIAFAMIFQKPLILLAGTGGVVDQIVQGRLLQDQHGSYHVAHSAEEAVNLAWSLVHP